jgi:hypothetical protein
LDGRASEPRTASLRRRRVGAYGRLQAAMARCARCRGNVEERFRFCPWCGATLRTKIVEFFMPHRRDAGKALRVTRYLTDDPHVRFSVWDESGVAEAAVSIDEREAGRLARFLRPVKPQVSLLDAARRAAGRRRPRRRSRTV